MRSGTSIVIGLAYVLAAAGVVEAARITVTASRSDLLYSQTEKPDCSALSKVADAQLPFYAVRLRATPPAGRTADRYQWSLPSPEVGVLAADEDLGPDAQTAVIHSLCAELGNGCVLTAEQLIVYSKPTILWIAPMCDILSDKTAKPFMGDTVKLGVQAFSGKRKVGKGALSVGYGRKSFVTLFVSSGPGDGYRDGQGKPFEPTNLGPIFAARLSGDQTSIPAITEYEFNSGGGGTQTVRPGCTNGFDACAAGFLYPPAAGDHVALVSAHLADDSALCDKLAVRVTATELAFTVDVTTNPKRTTFRAGDNVGLKVTVRNTSPKGADKGILFQGQSALTCETEVKVGKSKLTKSTQIDLQHCSATVAQPCENDGDCAQSRCDKCEQNEVCLTASHCAESLVPCVRDSDCGPVGSCVIVVPVPELVLGAGDVSNFVDSIVPMDNTLPSEAAVTETWVANSYNAGSQSKVVKYKIKPR